MVAVCSLASSPGHSPPGDEAVCSCDFLPVVWHISKPVTYLVPLSCYQKTYQAFLCSCFLPNFMHDWRSIPRTERTDDCMSTSHAFIPDCLTLPHTHTHTHTHYPCTRVHTVTADERQRHQKHWGLPSRMRKSSRIEYCHTFLTLKVRYPAMS